MMSGHYSYGTFKCQNCGNILDNKTEDFCDRQCELEALYEIEATCSACGGDGRGEENLRGEIGPCRKCFGTGYMQ